MDVHCFKVIESVNDCFAAVADYRKYGALKKVCCYDEDVEYKSQAKGNPCDVEEEPRISRGRANIYERVSTGSQVGLKYEQN